MVYAVNIAVLAMQNCLAKGQGLECNRSDICNDDHILTQKVHFYFIWYSFTFSPCLPPPPTWRAAVGLGDVEEQENFLQEDKKASFDASEAN